MGFNLQGGFGAGAGADMLQQILRQKALEFAQAEQIRVAEARTREDARQADQATDTARRGQDFSRESSAGNLALGRDTLGQRQTEFDAEAPGRAAGVALTGAQTGEILRKPQAEQEAREFTTSRDKTQHGYNLGEIGAQTAGQMRLQNARVAGAGAPTGPNAEQKNEWLDALKVIDEMVADPALPKAVGPLDQYGAGYVTDPLGAGDINRFKSKHDQLVGLLQLAQGGKLKGQGAVSEAERAMLAKAATSLKLGLREKDYVQELRNIQDYYKRKQEGDVRPLGAPGGGKIGRFEIVR